MVWVNSMIESAGDPDPRGPDEVDLDQAADREGARGPSASSRARSAAPPDIDTSTEDTARLSFEAGGSSFMLNYPFVYPSAKENAPDVFKQMDATNYPAVVDGEPSRAAARRHQPRGLARSPNNTDLTFEAIECLVGPENQLTAATLGGLPPTNEAVYDTKDIEKAYPGFSDLIKESIDNAAPRPLTPAYTDLSLAIQRSLHPPATSTRTTSPPPTTSSSRTSSRPSSGKDFCNGPRRRDQDQRPDEVRAPPRLDAVRARGR